MSATLGDDEYDETPSGRVVALRPAVGARGEPSTVVPSLASYGRPARSERRTVVPLAWSAGRPLADELEDVLHALTDQGPVEALRLELARLLRAWASALVHIHELPVDSVTRSAPLPWVLREEPVPAWATELPAVAGRAWAVRVHPAARRAVAEARAGWSTSRRVHGAAGDDVVITWDAGRHGSARLVPGSATGRGDARWDVASALDWIAVVLGPSLDPDWRIDPVADFLAAYRMLGGDAEPTRALAVARTIATAVEWSAALRADGVSEQRHDHEWLAALWARPLDLVTGATQLS